MKGATVVAIARNKERLLKMKERCKNPENMHIEIKDLAEDIEGLSQYVKELKEKRESIMSNQIGRSGTSIGANIREAHYAHGTADFIAKLQIALKEANETGYWLELLYKTNYINEHAYNDLEGKCKSIRAMLVASINTTKNKLNK